MQGLSLTMPLGFAFKSMATQCFIFVSKEGARPLPGAEAALPSRGCHLPALPAAARNLIYLIYLIIYLIYLIYLIHLIHLTYLSKHIVQHPAAVPYCALSNLRGGKGAFKIIHHFVIRRR